MIENTDNSISYIATYTQVPIKDPGSISSLSSYGLSVSILLLTLICKVPSSEASFVIVST